MELKNKLPNLLTVKKNFNGGFSTLTSDQLDKLKGGLHVPNTNTNIFNCGNCYWCINICC